MGNCVASKAYDQTLRDSLKTIRSTYRQLHVVTKADTTSTVLASRVELYGILLGEVTGIRSNLVAYLACTGPIPMRTERVNGDSPQEVPSL
jgi:hypothetical protein